MPYEPDLPEWMDPRRAAQIARLRALGHTQAQIASQLGISQQTVSRYLKGIQEASEGQNMEDFLFGLLLFGLGIGAMAALLKMFQGGNSNTF